MKVVREKAERMQGDAVHSLGPPEHPENEIVDLFGGTHQEPTMLRSRCDFDEPTRVVEHTELPRHTPYRRDRIFETSLAEQNKLVVRLTEMR